MLLVALFGWEGRALRAIRLAWFDACQSWAPRARLSTPAFVVAIDDESLAAYGQWPWPRPLLARLLEVIGRGGPLAIGIDILMPEPDRLSPERIVQLVPRLDPVVAERLARLPGNDAVLAASMGKLPVVLGVGGLDPGRVSTVTSLSQAPLLTVGGDPLRWIRPFGNAIQSVDPLARAAAGRGLLNVEPEQGVVRRVPLVAAVGPTVAPALSLEMLRVAAGASAFGVRVGPAGVEAVRVGDLSIPTEPDGSVWVHYSRPDPDRLVSAAELLKGTADPQRFEGKLVIVGVTALALWDYKATPVAARMLGPEIHAQILEGVVDRDFLSRPRWARWLEAALLAAGGLAIVLAVPVLPAGLSAVAMGGLVAAVLGVGVALYLGARVLFDVVSPGVGLVALFTAMLGMTLTEAQIQRRTLRRQVERQREVAARLAGELEAARRIQMGLLPVLAAALAGDARVAVAGFLEPARDVGGDLYDVFRLGADRVFFVIGDVAGKGVPGSLFMAVSKVLCKSAALRRGRDVAAIVRDANAEISNNNAEGLFVTAFAAILDARTGELEYCCAGHDPPYVLGGADLHRLGEGGGPPLCVVDDFPYTASTYRLRSGDAVCLLTDGVVEAIDAGGAFYGRPRLEALLRALAAASAAEIVERIREDVAAFAGSAEAADDVAILALEWRGAEPSPRTDSERMDQTRPG
jgi:serine phosphatase RsbU (regulator of sigma subunit)/CHASE2 domain-containing sensor protein